jgi:hypothetical protein
VFLENDATSARTLLISSLAPKSASQLQERGYEVIKADVSEFEVGMKGTRAFLVNELICPYSLCPYSLSRN